MGWKVKGEINDHGQYVKATAKKKERPREFYWSEAEYRARNRIPDEVGLDIDKELLRKFWEGYTEK